MKLLALIIFLCSFNTSWGKAAPKSHPTTDQKSKDSKNLLLDKYAKTTLDKKQLSELKKETLALGGKSVPALIEVMKSSKYPDKTRWMATFLLGQIMGDKAAPFIAKFVMHPHWVMRMAGLKTLLALKQDAYASLYVGALKDESFIVRLQALENIQKLKLDKYAPYVWAMLYDKRNYYQNKKGHKRSNIVKSIIKTVGDLKFDKAKEPLFKMVQKEKYKDIFEEVDYALSKITAQNSPKGDMKVKKIFWQRMALKDTQI